MAMDRDAMVEEVRANIRRKSTALADSRIITWLNWSQEMIASWHTYEEMRTNFTGTTSNDEKSYGFPDRMKDIHSMVLDTGDSESRKLIYVPARYFDKKVPRPEQTDSGKPNYYVDYGVNFELYRIPDASYTLKLRCSLFPEDLDAGTDESDLLRKDPLICTTATMLGLASLREVEDATYWKTEFVALFYKASLESDHSGEDWNPVARGFSSIKSPTGLGDYTSNPLVYSVR